MALNVSKPPISPPLIILAGGEGAGKTTLAAQFPKPVFIQAEKVDSTFDTWVEDEIPDMFPLLPSSSVKAPEITLNTFLNQVYQLIDEDHAYETLVIDSLSALHKLLELQLCHTYGVSNVAEACGGYGKYAFELQRMHSDIIGALNELREVRQMAVVALCHLEIQQLKQRPDGDPVVAFGLDLEKRSSAVWRQNASATLAIKLDEYIKGAERDKKGAITRAGRAVLSGDRQIVTDASTMGYGLQLCKNRFDLPAQIRLKADENPLLDLIPFFKG